MFFIYACFILQPTNEFGFAFFFDQLQHDGILFYFIECKPNLTKMFFLAKNFAGSISF
ncbi:hypothetical protein GALL_522540 [mine drainage metagenome]|uniref:Uncharacterized protein n=1 Tax=mine drainage metagenome TaxID=410659 RepID=A0A1J5PF76_9ZZZZ